MAEEPEIDAGYINRAVFANAHEAKKQRLPIEAEPITNDIGSDLLDPAKRYHLERIIGRSYSDKEVAGWDGFDCLIIWTRASRQH